MYRSIEDEYRIANENLRLLGVSAITSSMTGSEQDKVRAILEAYRSAMLTAPTDFLPSRSAMANQVTALSKITEHSKELLDRL